MYRLFVIAVLLIVSNICAAQNTVNWTKGNPLREDLYAWNPYGYINSVTSLDKNSKKLPYLIIFKDSTKLSTMAKIGEHKGNFFLYVDNETMTKSIRPNETLSITHTPKKGDTIVGMPMDSCWIFKLIDGPFNLYSVTPQPLDQFVIYVQEGSDGPMLPATKSNFRKLLGNDQAIAVDINMIQFSSAVTRRNLAIEREARRKKKQKE